MIDLSFLTRFQRRESVKDLQMRLDVTASPPSAMKSDRISFRQPIPFPAGTTLPSGTILRNAVALRVCHAQDLHFRYSPPPS